MSTGGRKVVKKGLNLVNIVKECPPNERLTYEIHY